MKDNLHLLYRDALNRLHLEVLSLRLNRYEPQHYMCNIFTRVAYQIADTAELRSDLIDFFEIDLVSFFGEIITRNAYSVEDLTNECDQNLWWYPPNAYELRLQFINWAIARCDKEIQGSRRLNELTGLNK